MTEEVEVAQKQCKTCGVSKAKTTENFYMMGAGRRYFSAECKTCCSSRRARAYAPVGRKRTKFEIHAELKEQAQALLNEGDNAKEVARKLDVSVLTVNKALRMGILTAQE